MSHRLHLLVLTLAGLFLSGPIAGAQDGFFDSDGVRIRYRVRGEGEPLVLVHGFAGSLDMWTMTAEADALADTHRLILMDARGHGRSGKPHDPEEYGAKMADDVVRLLDHLEIEKAHVVGYSMGGAITLRLVATHPDRLLSAVVGGFGLPAPPESPEKDFMAAIARALEAGEGFGPLFDAIGPAAEDAAGKARRRAMEQMLLAQNDALALAAVARGFHGLAPPTKGLRECSVPTLVLYGADDALAPDVERLKPLFPSAAYEALPDLDHMTALFDPAFFEKVLEFVAEHAREPVPAGK